jgi:hypothetical protein
MERDWLKLEAIKALKDRQELYLQYLVQLMVSFPASDRLKALCCRYDVLESQRLDLESIVQTRIFVGEKMPKVPNPMENDERWELETQKKNGK